MDWTTMAVVFVAWPIVRLVVAYLFGSFMRGAEAQGSARELMPPVVTYLRRKKRGKAIFRANDGRRTLRTRRRAA